MIWQAGDLAAPDHLRLPAADRIFEHGLGLFETFRTWDGRALLLDRHLDRLRSSAQRLGISLNGVVLPTPPDVSRLLAASGRHDALLRLTVSAGRPPDCQPTAWMTASALPAASTTGWNVIDATWTVACDDPLTRHKTLNYWARRFAAEQARASGADEAIFTSADGRIWEGSRSNLFLIFGLNLITPPRSGPIIPGIMRNLVAELAARADLNLVEADVTGATLAAADAVFLTNSVRGLIAVADWTDRPTRLTAVGQAHLAALRDLISEFLKRESARA